MKLAQWVGVICSMLLAGCGGVDQTPNESSVKGTAPAGASVSLYDFSGVKIGSAVASAEGVYEIDVVPREPELMYLQSSSGVVTLLDGTSLAYKTSEAFQASVYYAPAKDNVAHLDFLNTIATALTEYYVSVGKSPDEAYKTAYDAVEAWSTVDAREDTSNDLFSSVPANANVVSGVAAWVDSAVYDWCAQQKEWFPAEAAACSIPYMAQLVAKDAKYDGVINGKYVAGNLKFAGKELDQGFLRQAIPLSLLKKSLDTSLAYDKNLAVSVASKMTNQSIQEVADNVDPTIPKDEPYLTVAGMGGEVSGTAVFYVDLFDYDGVKYLQLDISGQSVSLDPKPLAISLDTTAFANGAIPLVFTATDTLGYTSTASGTITVNNKGDIIKTLGVGDASVQVKSGTVDLTAGIALDQGITSVQFLVDSAEVGSFGAAAEGTGIRAFAQSINTATMNDGYHLFEVLVNTGFGNTYKMSYSFVSDNTAPTVEWDLAEPNEEEYPDVPVFSGVEDITFTVKDKSPVKVINVYFGEYKNPIYTLQAGGDLGQEEYVYNVAISVDVRTVYEARHKIRVVPEDVASNVGGESRDIIVDWQAPIVKFVTANGTILRGDGPHYVEFTARDTYGIESAEFITAKVSDPDRAEWEGAVDVQFDPATGIGQVIVSPPEGDDGLRKLDIATTDMSGKSSGASINVVYGNYAPIIFKIEPLPSGDNIGYRLFMRDPYSFGDPTMDQLTAVVAPGGAGGKADRLSNLTPLNANGEFSVDTSKYRTTGVDCNPGESVERKHVAVIITYASSTGHVLSFQIDSRVSGFFNIDQWDSGCG